MDSPLFRLIVFDASGIEGTRQAETLARSLLERAPAVVCLYGLRARALRDVLAWRLHPFLPFVAGLEESLGLLIASRFPFADLPRLVPLSVPLPFVGTTRDAGLIAATLDLSDAPGASLSTRLLLAHLALPRGVSARAASTRRDAVQRAATLLADRFATHSRREGRDPDKPHPAHEELFGLLTLGLGAPADRATSSPLPIPPSPELEEALAILHQARDLYRLAHPTDPGETSPEGRTSLALGVMPTGIESGRLAATRASVDPVLSGQPHSALMLDLGPSRLPFHGPRVPLDYLPPSLDPIHAKGPLARRHGRYEPALLERSRQVVEGVLALFDQKSDLTDSLRGSFVSGSAPGVAPSHRETSSPTTRSSLMELVRHAKGPLRPVAMGRAMSGIIEVMGTRLDLRGLRGVSFGRDRSGHATCVVRAGTSFGQVNAALRADTATQSAHDDQVLMNQPGYAGLSLVGCLSVGGHGSGMGYGALASAVSSLELVTRDTTGQVRVRVLDRDAPDLFRAALVSLGLCGVITEVTVGLQPAFRIRELRHKTTWGALVAGGLDALIAWNEAAASERRGIPHSFEIWVNIYTGKAVVGRRWKTFAECSGRRASAQLWDGWGAVETLFDQVEDRLSRPGEAVAALLDSALDGTVHGREVVMSAAEGLDFATTNNFAVLSSAAAVRGHELVPAMERVIALARLLAFEVADEAPAFLASPVGIRFVRNQPTAERPFLAPQFDFDPSRDLTPLSRVSAMIELPGLATVRGTRRALDTIIMDLVRRFGARPHWGQHLPAAFDRAALEAVYPADELRAFRAARRVLDPTALFDNELAHVLGL